MVFTLGVTNPTTIIAGIVAIGLIVRGFGEGSLIGFGFQRNTIKTLKDKIESLEQGEKTRDARIAELESIIENTRNLTPIIDQLRLLGTQMGNEHRQLGEALAANTTALQSIAMLVHAQGDSHPSGA